MRSVKMLSVMFALTFTTGLSADELAVGTYLQGNWIIVGEAAGEKVKGFMTVRPTADGRCQFYNWTLNYPDEVKKGAAIGGIDAKSGKFVENGFSGEDHFTNAFDDVLGDNLGKTTGTRVGTANGEPFEGRLLVERTSQDRFVYKVESEDGVVMDLVFEKRGAESDGEKAFKAYAELALGGTWVSEVDGMQFEDTYDWIFDGQFLRLTSKPVGEFSENITILGVDPVTNKFTWWGYHADGRVSIGTTRQVNEGVWVGRWSGKGPTGGIASRGRLTKVDDDTIKYEVLERTIEGDLPEFPKVTTWKRKR